MLCYKRTNLLRSIREQAKKHPIILELVALCITPVQGGALDVSACSEQKRESFNAL